MSAIRTDHEILQPFLARLSAQLEQAEAQKFSVANLSTWPVEDLRAVIEALSLKMSSDSVWGVKVKPLEWGSTSYGRPEAHSVGGVYRITEAWSGGWAVSIRNEMLREPDGRENFATQAVAKAAAQRDYEARIMSALTAMGGHSHG